MFGSLSDFIEVEMPLIQSKLTMGSNNQEDKLPLVEQLFRKKVNSQFNSYQPSDKTHLLKKFNLKNQTHKKNTSFLPQSKSYRSQSQRKPLYINTSFFAKSEITKDYIAKTQLKRKHNLLRAIVRTNQNDNTNEGVSDYDQSFKRLYDNFKSIYAKPILQARNFQIDDSYDQILLSSSIQTVQKPTTTLSNRKRIEYENCLNWAKKHKKKGQFYEQQLGKHLKQKKQQIMNQGHSLMPQIQRRMKTLSQSLRVD